MKFGVVGKLSFYIKAITGDVGLLSMQTKTVTM